MWRIVVVIVMTLSLGQAADEATDLEEGLFIFIFILEFIHIALFLPV